MDDSVISAEIPDSENDPLLSEFITKHIIHRPYAVLISRSPCMKEKMYEEKKAAVPKKKSKTFTTNNNGWK